MRSTIRRLAACTAAAASLLVVFGATPASAHVVIVGEGVKGESATISFRVPSESETASTSQLQVKLPEEYPLGSVRVEAKPGWTATITKRTIAEPVEVFGEPVSEVVDTITWTGGKIGSTEFDSFTVRVGPLPDDTDEWCSRNPDPERRHTADWIEVAEGVLQRSSRARARS